MIGLARRICNPVRLFGFDDEIMKKLVGLLSAALYIEDRYLVAKLFHEKFYHIRDKLPPAVAFLFLLEKILPLLLARVIFSSINIFAGAFIAGNGFQKIIKKAESYQKIGFLVNFDILGEAVLGEKEAERYQRSYLNFIKEIGSRLPFGALSISLKGSAFYSQANPCAPKYSARKIVEKLTPIMEAAVLCGGHAYLDAEEYWFRLMHFLAFKELYEKFGSAIRFVLQSYLKTYEDILDRLISINNAADPVWVRVVRGAYWDCEIYKSEIMSWADPPVFLQKEKTDIAYETAIRKGLASGLNMVPATHNVSSICFALEHSLAAGKPIAEVQLLYGMGESMGRLLISKKIPVRFYMPIQYPEGKLREASGYLIRRVNESQLSFIMKGFAQISSQDKKLLRKLPRRMA